MKTFMIMLKDFWSTHTMNIISFFSYLLIIWHLFVRVFNFCKYIWQFLQFFNKFVIAIYFKIQKEGVVLSS